MSNTYELEPIDNPAEFSAAVAETAEGKRNELVLGKWPGGILEFAGIIFPGVDPQDIFAIHITRSPEGRGAHFDAYKSYVDEERPWLGHFNLSGDAGIVTTELPSDLAEAYDARYPIQTDESAAARRHFSRIALEDPASRVGVGTMYAGTRMLLPIRSAGPHIIHDIVPQNPEQPGEFIKLIVPTRAGEEREQLLQEDYSPLDSFITNALGYEVEQPVGEAPKTVGPMELEDDDEAWVDPRLTVRRRRPFSPRSRFMTSRLD